MNYVKSPYITLNSNNKPNTSGRSTNEYARKEKKVYSSLSELASSKSVKDYKTHDFDRYTKETERLADYFKKHDRRGKTVDPVSGVTLKEIDMFELGDEI